MGIPIPSDTYQPLKCMPSSLFAGGVFASYIFNQSLSINIYHIPHVDN